MKLCENKMRGWFAGVCATVALLFSGSVRAGLFDIAAPTFSGFARCDGEYVIADEATGGKISKSKLRNGKLYFSFRVIGGQKAIDHLKEHGTLVVTAVVWAGARKLLEESIGITQSNWERNGAALTNEFQTNGLFNWRTCIYTRQIEPGPIAIKIRDPFADDVGLVADGNSYEASVDILP